MTAAQRQPTRFVLALDADCFTLAPRARIFARYLGEGRAGGFPSLQAPRATGRAAAASPGALPACLCLVETSRKDLGGVAIALALKQALAEPVIGVRRQPIARIFLHEGAQAFLGERVVLAQHVAVGEVVFVLRLSVVGAITICWRRSVPLGLRGGGGGKRARYLAHLRRVGGAFAAVLGHDAEIERRAGLRGRRGAPT